MFGEQMKEAFDSNWMGVGGQDIKTKTYLQPEQTFIRQKNMEAEHKDRTIKGWGRYEFQFDGRNLKAFLFDHFPTVFELRKQIIG